MIAPGISVEKTPDSQTVDSGSTVTFTIQVTNTGDVTLTNVTVTDPNAPLCATNLGTMNPGATSSYLCQLANVTADFTNVATVVGTPPVGPDVADLALNPRDSVTRILNPITEEATDAKRTVKDAARFDEDAT